MEKKAPLPEVSYGYGQQPIPQQPTQQEPIPQQPTQQEPIPQQPIPQQPIPLQPIPQQPTQQQPIPQQPILQYPIPQQPILQQPTQQQHSSNQNTVVVNQQSADTTPTQRAWTQSLCGCFDDCEICVCVTFCGPCAACQLAQHMGEFVCLACCVPNWMTAARTKVRMQRKIQGSICDDCCVTTCCSFCAMCQLWREVKVARLNGEM
ncbi:placenta-specific gene 8 protein-like [Littorina saxatilis]|uniref:Uncharacterized protein n=1 Tax=Littorina saxatilis TaxID=31220 RepID=A0AAN9GF82_9CAEN